MTYQCNDCAGAGDTPRRRKHSGKFTRRNIRTRTFQKLEAANSGWQCDAIFTPRLAQTSRQPAMLRNWDARDFFETRQPARNTQKRQERILEGAGSGISFPKGIRFGICILCKKLTITKQSDNPRFHWACHNEWEGTPEGRQFQSLRVRGQEVSEASLAPSKRGRPERYSDDNAGNNLATAYRWAIQHLLEKTPFRQIEKENGVLFSTVRNQIRALIKKLPDPKLLASQFQPTVRALLAASGSLLKE